jgi:hypothetical protein
LLLGLLLLPGRLQETKEQTFLDDARMYNAGAVSIVEHGTYADTDGRFISEREPGYSLMLAAVYGIAGTENRAAIFLFQTLLHAMASLILVRALRHSISLCAQSITAAFLLLSPAVLHMTLFVYRESVSLSLFLVVLAGLLEWLHAPRLRTIVLTGLAAGVLAITYLPMLPVLGLLLLVPLLKKKTSHAAIGILLLLLPLALWAGRNFSHPSGRDCPLGGCVRSAYAWYMRQHQATDFSWDDPLRCLWAEYVTRKLENVPLTCDFGILKGVDINDVTAESITSESLRVIRSHMPMYLWTSAVWAVKYHFPYVNGWGTLYNVLELLVTLLLYAGIAAGVLLKRRRWDIIYWLPLLIGPVLFGLIDVEPRYRMPFLGAYAVLAGIGYDLLFLRMKRLGPLYTKTNVWWACVIVLAIIFGALCLLPTALQRIDREYPYRGVTILATDAEAYYAVRTREVADGFPKIGNAYYSSPKDLPTVQPGLPERLIGRTALLLRADPIAVFVAAKGVFGAALFIIMAGAIASLFQRRWEALAATSMLMFAGALLGGYWDWPKLLLDPTFAYDFLRFSRPINPQWSALCFFGGIWLLASWERERTTWKAVAAGIAMTAMLYAYVYAWSYFAVIVILVGTWHAWKREWRRCGDLTLLCGIVAVLGMPYFIDLISALRHPWYEVTAMRMGVVEKRSIFVGFWSLLFLALSLISRRIWPHTWPLLPALSVGALIAMNQQIITGKELVPHHYHWYFLHPLACITTMVMMTEAGKRLLRHRRVLRFGGVFVTIAAVAFGTFQQIRAYQAVRGVWGHYQEYAPVYAFLRKNTKPGVSVGTAGPTSLRDFIPVFTPADVHTSGQAYLSLTPMERPRDMLFFDLWLQNITPQEAAERFRTTMRAEVSAQIYAIYYRELSGRYEAIPDAVLQEHADAYAAYWELPFSEKISQYPLDLVIWTPQSPNTPQSRQLHAAGTSVYDDGGYSIISLQRSPHVHIDFEEKKSQSHHHALCGLRRATLY